MPSPTVYARDDVDGLDLRVGGRDERVAWADVSARVTELEAGGPRWVWADVARSYPHLLGLGVRVARCRDLRMIHSLLATSPRLAWPADPAWTRRVEGAGDGVPTLLDLPGAADSPDLDALVAQDAAQQEALAGAGDGGRLRFLAAAESAGALVAAEMRWWGMPWDVAEHDRILVGLLGARGPSPLSRPARLEELAGVVRAALARPDLNPDSQPALLSALRGAGLDVASTSKWELRGIDHPVVEPLLEYKKLSRLWSANGWAWLDRWVAGGRFRPDYVSSGVVTGRWATNGGGALQLPKEIRSAVRAGEGRRLVVADARQLEPRVLAGMSGDAAMAAAARGVDLYAGLVEQRVVATRAEAKGAMLGAMYGATQGAGGALVPQLRRAYPAAMGLVDGAARAGERGEAVSTWLGRGSPRPPWADRLGTEEPLTEAERARVRDWGRFTRNFVVQGTAAEWALCWLAQIRTDLAALTGSAGCGGGGCACGGSGAAGASDAAASVDARLVYFLHDEVVVECRADLADAAADIVTRAAQSAGDRLFGGTIDFPVAAAVVTDYAQSQK